MKEKEREEEGGGGVAWEEGRRGMGVGGVGGEGWEWVGWEEKRGVCFL